VCFFSVNKNVKSKAYTAEDIKAYGIDKLKYYEAISPGTENGKTMRTFATMLLGGRVSLFETRDNKYLRHDSLGTWDITFKGMRDMLAMNKVRRLMNFAFSDCKMARPIPWDSIVLDDKKIVELINTYNACKGSTIKYNANASIPLMRATFGLLAGAVSSTYSFGAFSANSGANVLQGMKFDSYSSTAMGASLGLTFPRFSNNFEAYADASYFKTTNTGQATGNGLSGVETESVKLSATYLRTGFGIRLLFPARGITPYLKLGVSHFFASDFLGTRTRIVGSTSPVTSTPWANANQDGIWGGLGIQKRVSGSLALNIEAKYETTSGFSMVSLSTLGPSGPKYPIVGSYLTFLVGIVF
jgi:opacity protein-like surface antigen